MSMVNLATRVLVVATMALWPIACGGSDASSASDEPCTPGLSEACTCPADEEMGEESEGARTCDESGVFSECVCNASPCGNGTIDMGEQCEPGNTNGETCADATLNAKPTGTLGCSSSCTFDVSGCTGTTVSTGGMTSTGGAGPTGGTGSTMGAGGLMGEGGLMGAGGTLGG